MAGLFDADAYECDDLPERFYRVTYPGSQTRDEDTGDYVSDTTLEISDDVDLKEIVEDHFYWRRAPSPFISVFCDERHARNWARKRVDKLNCSLGDVYISEIDTAKLPAGTTVFEATLLADMLDIYHPYSENEYLVLHRISCVSIVSTRSLEEIEADELAHTMALFGLNDPIRMFIDQDSEHLDLAIESFHVVLRLPSVASPVQPKTCSSLT
ncbi:uncharacterized protein TRIREDRAFT_121111 [Trichoderma reesei QM6a]|uniref:Predicted protein n=2 Tax=Hypocrea jecorina TaxID=51453 RepID=G0REP6_HYPJQ|nr:uncharacterized protein TRIREDRAFT_121111 [Trichoderma reesei QM6a]EGR50522.1 predicted protein [Trichoderma reesei QM6a]